MEKEIYVEIRPDIPRRGREMSGLMKKAGFLYVLAGSIALLGIITGEMFYPEVPGYTTRYSQISDLGATMSPDSIITQPSAAIFNTTMLITGALLIFGAYLAYMAFRKKGMGAVFMLTGIGALGVGIFPGDMAPRHAIFALLTFVFGALSAIISARVMLSPLRYLYMIFGATSLVFLFGNQAFVSIFGIGGVERYVAYPIVLWLVSFGGYLIGKDNQEQD